MFPDFIPVEPRGMSVLTALFFFFTGIGATLFIQFVKREFKRIDRKIDEEMQKVNSSVDRANKRIDQGNDKLDDTKNDIAEMKTNIALLLQSTKRIEKILEKHSDQLR